MNIFMMVIFLKTAMKPDWLLDIYSRVCIWNAYILRKIWNFKKLPFCYQNSLENSKTKYFYESALLRSSAVYRRRPRAVCTPSKKPRRLLRLRRKWLRWWRPFNSPPIIRPQSYSRTLANGPVSVSTASSTPPPMPSRERNTPPSSLFTEDRRSV